VRRAVLGAALLTVMATLLSLLGTDCHCRLKNECGAQLSAQGLGDQPTTRSPADWSGNLQGGTGTAPRSDDAAAASTTMRHTTLSVLECPEEGYFRFDNYGVFLEFDESEIAYSNLGGTTLQKTDSKFLATNPFLQGGGDPSYAGGALPQGIYYKGVGRDVQPTEWVATEAGELAISARVTNLDLYVRNVTTYAPNPRTLAPNARTDDTPEGSRGATDLAKLNKPGGNSPRAFGDAAFGAPPRDFGRINLADGQTTLFEYTLIDSASGSPHPSSSEPSLYFVDLDVGPGGLFETLTVCGLSGWATASEDSKDGRGLFDGITSRIIATPVEQSTLPLFAPFASELGQATACVRFQGTERHGGANNPNSIATVERAARQRSVDIASGVRKSVLPNLVKLIFPAGACARAVFLCRLARVADCVAQPAALALMPPATRPDPHRHVQVVHAVPSRRLGGSAGLLGPQLPLLRPNQSGGAARPLPAGL